MRSLRMECMSVFVIVSTLWLPITEGCSLVGGSLPDPTPVGSVHFATHVVVGSVWGIVRPDPRFSYLSDDDGTYGANITVQCTYKGGNLSTEILIGAAGFVGGMCRAMPLEAGNDYIMFLSEGQVINNKTVYVQTHPAELKTNLHKYLNICDLERKYIEENPVSVCPATSVPDGGECKRYSSGSSGLFGSSVIAVLLAIVGLAL